MPARHLVASRVRTMPSDVEQMPRVIERVSQWAISSMGMVVEVAMSAR
jgi:hypothetical protein